MTNKLVDLNRKLEEANKYTLELKRLLKDAEIEKMLLVAGADELREAFKHVEGELLTNKKCANSMSQ